MSEAAPIGVVVVDDTPVLRVGMATLLGAEHGIVILGCAGSARDAAALIRRVGPQIVVVDLALACRDGFLSELCAASPRPGCLALAGCDAPELMRRAVREGAAGCLSKWSASTDLAQAVRAIHRGDPLGAAVHRVATGGGTVASASDIIRIAGLTLREESILTLLGIGLSNRDIGLHLALSEKTVKHYLTSILSKLEVKNRVQAAVLQSERRRDTVH